MGYIMHFNMELGGVSIEVRHRYNFIRSLCQDYLTEKPAAFSVCAEDGAIRRERELTDGRFPEAVCESTCLHRKIVQELVKHGLLLIHSAVIAVDGVGYAFLAKSGVGKSTHIRLWQQAFGSRAVVVNGDKPMYSFQNGVLMAHGSPWRGKEGLGSPISVPVGGICLLERGETNAIAPASQAQVVDKLFHQVLLPGDPEELTEFMDIVNRIVLEVPFYTLKCNMEQHAALVAYEGMKRGNAQ